MGRRWWILTTLAVVNVAVTASAGETVTVITNGAAKPQIATGDVGSLIALGTTGAYSQAGGVVNDKVTNGGNAVPISFMNANGGVNLTYPGVGEKNGDKYTKGVGNTQTLTSTSTKTVGPNTTTSTATGMFVAANPAKMGRLTVYNSTLTATGSVVDKAGVGGIAASTAKDPMTFQFSSAGTFSFGINLGDSSTTSPGTNLEFSSNSDQGVNHLDLSASLSGVTYDGTSFNGTIFSLVIDSTGPITSSSDLTINFVPSPVLGLSQSTINAVDSYVAANLTPQADGSVGLAAGADFALIGPGAPIDTLNFDYAAGSTVVYEDTLTVGAASVPEPSSVVLGLIGVLGGIGYFWARRTGAPA